ATMIRFALVTRKDVGDPLSNSTTGEAATDEVWSPPDA
ncbi:hypothetical protein Tco_0582371, partial [Tanacetum coccineum]